RADGSTEDSDFKRSSAVMVVQNDEVATLSLERRIELLEKLARELAEDISRNLFESLNTTLEDAGQTVDLKGMGLSAEAILTIMQTIDLEFDEKGQHSPLTLVSGSFDKDEVRN